MLAAVVLTMALAAAIRMALGPQLQRGLSACALYYHALWVMVLKQASYDDIRRLCGAPRIPWSKKIDKDSVPKMSPSEEFRLFSAVWLHTLGLNFALWDKPHYRAGSLREDLVANFSNIAFPGTGIPMSWVCCCKPAAQLYLFVFHPWVVLVVSVVVFRSEQHREGRAFAEVFEEELLAPKHWFALWRINSTLVAAHHQAHNAQPRVQNEYKYENKWDFLELALQQSKLPPGGTRSFKVTPVITDVPELVCKHKNIEGGMGIHMFKNAVHGGDWILQERLQNCEELQALLPATAPLSTFRVITMVDPTVDFESSHIAMTFVWRAGRAGKSTDHSSVLFAVDPDTLKILDGKMFSNWYQVGKVASTNLLSKKGVTAHPDSGQELKGEELACANSATENCIEAHRRLMPNVPVIGWDVAVAEGHGSVLLEANLSCNFFGGIYDRQRYLRIVDTYYANGCRPGPSTYMKEEGLSEASSTATPGSGSKKTRSSAVGSAVGSAVQAK
jgi:hypothetical protein